MKLISKSIDVEYGRGKNKKACSVLKPGAWTKIIFDEFLKTYKFPYCYIFKICKVYTSESAKHFIVFYATCKFDKCKADLKGVADNRPLEDQPLKLTFKTRDTRGIKHNCNFKKM